MDRFIESVALGRGDTESDLKSSMDRFIGLLVEILWLKVIYLKSSMDRFIVSMCLSIFEHILRFKIQYG